MNRRTVLLETPDLLILRFDHPPHEAHEDPDSEVSDDWAIAFVEHGTLDITVDARRHHLAAGSVFLPRPGLRYRCSHGALCPEDVCVGVGFAPHALAGAEHAWERAGWTARRSATPRLAHIQRRMSLAAAVGDPFELERWGLAALSALEADSTDLGARGRYAVDRPELEAVIACCRAIEADPGAQKKVADRAHEVGLASPVLTRAFRRYLGVSPHQYVLRWRLVTAATLLDDGHSVSESSLRAGFENLSHFCRTFRRIFGVQASGWRRLTLRERRQRVLRFLKAGSARARAAPIPMAT